MEPSGAVINVKSPGRGRGVLRLGSYFESIESTKNIRQVRSGSGFTARAAWAFRTGIALVTLGTSRTSGTRSS